MGPWRKWGLCGFTALLAVTGVLVLSHSWWGSSSVPNLGLVRLHLTSQPVVAAFFQASHQGYFADAGLDVRLISHPTGRQALAAMVSNGDDYAVCADTPFVKSFAQGQAVSVLASFGQAANSTHFIGRRERGITAELKSLVGHRLGIVKGTNAEYVFYSACLLEDISADGITLVDLSAEDLIPALLDGRVDAAALWDTLLDTARTGLGSAAIEITIDDIYRSMWLVVVNGAQRDQRRERALLTGLMRATEDLRRSPRATLGGIVHDIGITPSDLDWVMRLTRFRVNLDQSLLLNLESQRRWMGIGGREIFDGLSPLPLSQVDPNAVNLVHPEIAP